MPLKAQQVSLRRCEPREEPHHSARVAPASKDIDSPESPKQLPDRLVAEAIVIMERFIRMIRIHERDIADDDPLRLEDPIDLIDCNPRPRDVLENRHYENGVEGSVIEREHQNVRHRVGPEAWLDIDPHDVRPGPDREPAELAASQVKDAFPIAKQREPGFEGRLPRVSLGVQAIPLGR